MVAKDIFKDLSKNSTLYKSLESNPTVKSMLNTFFQKYGFKRYKYKESSNFNSFIEEDLTVYSYVSFNNLSRYNSTFSYFRLSLRLNLYSNFDYVYYYQFDEGIKIYPFDKKDNSYPLAIYFKERNILYIPFYLMGELSNSSSEELYKTVLEILSESIEESKVEFKKVDISNFVDSMQFNKLKSNLTQELNNFKSNLIDYESNIETHSKSVTVYMIKRRDAIKIIENLELLSLNFNKTIKKNLSEVKSLKFVSKYEFVPEGIRFYLGKISYEDEIEEKKEEIITKNKVKCYLGDYSFMLINNAVKIENKDSLKVGDYIYSHMHSSSQSTCYGDYMEKISKLISEFKFKELCFLIYSYLKSYNKEDCICKFDKFYHFRKEEGKFDEDGNILKSYKEKKEEPKKELKVGAKVRRIDGWGLSHAPNNIFIVTNISGSYVYYTVEGEEDKGNNAHIEDFEVI